jgi:hypothetical protein
MPILPPTSEYYNDAFGEFDFYDTNSTATNLTLSGQSHIDIRAFTPALPGIEAALMYELDGLNMGSLNSQTMQSLDNFNPTMTLDNWSFGSILPKANINNIPCLTISGTPGIISTTSVTSAIDLSSFTTSGTLALTMPNYPFSGITTSGSSLTLSDGVNTTTLPFAQSLTTPSSGEVSWPLTALGAVLRPTTVTLSFNVASTCAIYVSNLRALASTWTPLKLDINTRRQTFNPVVVPTGSPPTTPFPKVLRANNPPGYLDPRPINGILGAIFYTGSRTMSNNIDLFFRDRNAALITQVDLNGTPQSQLDALGHQPDFGTSYYIPDTQTLLDAQNQNFLDTQTQYELERYFTVTNESYIKASIAWSPSTTAVSFGNFQVSAQQQYTFSGLQSLQPQSYYLFGLDCEDTSAHVTLDPLTSLGEVTTSGRVFDSTTIDNPSVFIRDPGRFGYQINLNDGDAFIREIALKNPVYAEFRSKTFASRTPVDGTSLTVSATPPSQLYTGANPFNGAILSVDPNNTNSSNPSIKVTTNAPVQGVVTELFSVTSASSLSASFDIYWPSTLANQGILPQVFCFNSFDAIISLPVNSILYDQWQTISFQPGFTDDVTDTCRLGIVSVSPFNTTCGSIIYQYKEMQSSGQHVQHTKTPGTPIPSPGPPSMI